MMTMVSTFLSFLAGGLPKLLSIFQDRQDKKHELALVAAQKERELALAERGFLAQAKVEEIKLEQIQTQTAGEERQALYQHDIEIGKGASQWMINLRSGVRPMLTYGFFLLFAFVEIGGFCYAWYRDIAFDVLIAKLWDADTQIIFASIISFHFGGRAFKGGKD